MSSQSALIFGEILFDSFPDGSRVAGGAPFNVAWHLRGLGLSPYLVSRIGKDAAGAQLLQLMQAWGMQCGGVQRDALHPTGQVEVLCANGQHSFSILPDQAYDFIEVDSLPRCPFGLLYYGSLIQRHAVSRQSLKVLKTGGYPWFVDINLRDPWWTPEIVLDSVQQARWLKINDEELARLRDVFGVKGDFRGQWALALREKYDLEWLIVTCGAEGAFLVNRQQQVFSVTPPADIVVIDTVGAGDAFCALLIVGILQGWTEQRTLQAAQAFASQVCQMRGATAQNPQLYAEFLKHLAQQTAD